MNASSKRAIGIMGKVPAPGQVKTRLSPPLSPEQVSSLYAALLSDTISVANAVENANVSVFHQPAADLTPLTDLVPNGVPCIADTGVELGENMLAAFVDMFDRGARYAVVIGSDLPTITRRHIECALEHLENGTEVVIGPSDDGGYYLIGLTMPRPDLFGDMVWSTSRVLSQTLERAHSSGLTTALIERCQDIDDAADLKRCVELLASSPEVGAEHTRLVLSAITGCDLTLDGGKRLPVTRRSSIPARLT